MTNEEPKHVNTTEARVGGTPHMTRYVLVFGLLLVIVFFVVIVFVAAA
jgi:hypothetical protein